MKKMCLIVLASIALSVFAIGPSWAGGVDKLIDKLVEKKILTRSEAKELVEQMQAEETKEKKEVASTGEAKVIKIPDWVGNTKLTGDVRARYETSDTENDKSNSDRNRERFRLRLGVETVVNDQWKAGFGLASGSSDPRSVDQTMEDDFSHKSINLDYAYAQYAPVKWATLVAGKFKNPIWNPEQLIWDSDINPEGAAVSFKFEPVKNFELFANIGSFTLEEFSAKANDPYLIAIQPGVNLKLPGDMYLKVAGTYYDFNYVKGNKWKTTKAGDATTGDGTWGTGTNTNVAGVYQYDYDSFAGDVEFGMIKIPGPIPYAAVYGQYIHATDAHDNNDGWLAGFKFGDKSIKDFGDWQLSYNYRRLERDAWPDFLPESTAYNGNTNIKGHKVCVGYGIYKNVSLGINYYNDKHIHRTTDDTQTVLQADLNVKF